MNFSPLFVLEPYCLTADSILYQGIHPFGYQFSKLRNINIFNPHILQLIPDVTQPATGSGVDIQYFSVKIMDKTASRRLLKRNL